MNLQYINISAILIVMLIGVLSSSANESIEVSCVEQSGKIELKITNVANEALLVADSKISGLPTTFKSKGAMGTMDAMSSSRGFPFKHLILLLPKPKEEDGEGKSDYRLSVPWKKEYKEINSLAVTLWIAKESDLKNGLTEAFKVVKCNVIIANKAK